MTKIKITAEIDVDFQKFFDEIPEGLFNPDNPDNGKVDDDYIMEVVWDVARSSHVYQLEKHMMWMTEDDMKEKYKYVKHHKKIECEVGKQIAENLKIEIIK